MRYLNKVIFINSANIPYAEVNVDGNVHFSGTQGAGKSTVLRSLVFFYSADKYRLGIESENKSFDEFYFNYTNSYIVYEVKVEEGAYTVIAYKLHGKVCFRFVDAPYSRQWFMDDGGFVESSWQAIRRKIDPHIDVTPCVDSYEFYRKILYGSVSERNSEFDKYALLIGKGRFQNIPRSIQNIFLNSKLSADFIKSTVIQSIYDKENYIDLSVYRKQISDFEYEYDEVYSWYRTEPNGDTVVRSQAFSVMDTYNEILECDNNSRLLWEQINYAYSHTLDDIPLLEKRLSLATGFLSELNTEKESVQKKFSVLMERLNRDRAFFDVRLEDIKTGRDRYEKNGIKDIVSLVSRKPSIELERQRLEKELFCLEKTFTDISDRYRALYSELDLNMREYKIMHESRKNSGYSEFLAAREKLSRDCNSELQAILAVRDVRLAECDGRIESLNRKHSECQVSLSEIKHWHPNLETIESLKAEMSQTELEIVQLKNDLEKTEAKNNLLSSELEFAVSGSNSDYDRKISLAEEALSSLNSELESVDRLLQELDGTFYEWLCENKPDWKDTIGKVVDERQILYAHGLNPVLCSGDSLFGVRLDLDSISGQSHTPEEYMQQRENLRVLVDSRSRELENLKEEKSSEAIRLRNSYRKRFSDLEKQRKDNVFYKNQKEQHLSFLQKSYTKAVDDEEALKSKEYGERSRAVEDAQTRLDREKEARRELESEFADKEKAARMEFSERERKQEADYEEFCDRLNRDLADYNDKIKAQKAEYENSEKKELTSGGADTQAIERCRNEISSLEEILRDIESKEPYVIEYRKDEKELFSHEAEYISQRNQLVDRICFETDKHKESEREFKHRIDEIQAEIGNIKSLHESETGYLREYANICQVENLIPDSLSSNACQKETGETLGELISKIRGELNLKRIKVDELKRYVHSFSSNFRTNDNIFCFKSPVFENDYMEFALNLIDFVENNKIDDYRKCLSNHYHSILQDISREVGLIMSHMSEVKSVVEKLNRDFIAHNFAGVIKSLEMRIVKSDDSLMRLLVEIQKFTLDNSFSMGEPNLFSDDSSDEVNRKVVGYLKELMEQLRRESSREQLSLSDTFILQFNIRENNNSSGWIEHIGKFGSNGTGVLIKAMVNIMLISIFKSRSSGDVDDFTFHCMMDEIGTIHPSNVSGLLKFANDRNIFIIHCSPVSNNANDYKYNYLMTKDSESQSRIRLLLMIDK